MFRSNSNITAARGAVDRELALDEKNTYRCIRLRVHPHVFLVFVMAGAWKGMRARLSRRESQGEPKRAGECGGEPRGEPERAAESARESRREPESQLSQLSPVWVTSLSPGVT